MNLFARSTALAVLTIASIQAATFDFEKDALGKAPKGFTCTTLGNRTAPVKWVVQSDRQAFGGSRALAQIGQAAGGLNYAVAWIDGYEAADGEVTVKIKSKSGQEAPGAGIVWRYTDEKNYYSLYCSSKEDNCRVMRVIKGKTKIVDTKTTIFTPEVWHTLRVVFAGKSYMVFMDGELALGGKDKGLLTPGKAGLITQADAVTYFDDIKTNP